MCPSSPTVSIELVMDRSAARRARHFLDEHWCVEHAALLRPQAEVVVSELVTHAATNGRPPVSVSLECDVDEGVTISVSDAAVEQAVVLDGGSQTAAALGVQLVDVLSDEWGVRTGPGRKTVWSRFLY